MAHDLEAEAAAIEESRLERRDDFLLKSAKARVVRDRLDRQRAKAERKRKEREREADKQRKIAESHVTREQRWESVEKVRAEFDPPRTPEREQIHAERRARRAAYDVEQAEKAAKAAQQPPKPKEQPAPKHHPSAPEPSVLRTQVEQEQQDRRDEWFASHPARVKTM